MKLTIGKQESELIRAAQAAMGEADAPADGISEMSDAPAPAAAPPRTPAVPPEDPRDVMEAMALRELGAPAVAAAAIELRGDAGPDEALDRAAAEIMAEEGLALPRLPSNRVGDKEHCDEALTILGRTLHPSLGFEKFGYYQQDRALHTHIVGYSGGGKSTLLENIIIQDIWFGRGGMYIDPHGDSSERILNHIPPWRMKDVVYLDFGSKEALVGLNALETVDETSADERQRAVNSVVDLLRRKCDINEKSTPRLMKYLVMGLTSLAYTPGMTMLEVMPLFTDKTFQTAIRSQITDRTLLNWWSQRFDNMMPKQVVDDTSSLENRLNPLSSDIYLRSVLGQSRSTIDFAEIMDSGKFVIANMSKGNTSDLFRETVGTVLVMKVLNAALSRQGRIPDEQRVRFALIIDEFQNFVTKDFNSILEEARKYGLSLTVAHQGTGQVTSRDPDLLKSLENNVANRFVYGVGTSDAAYFEPLMSPMSKKDLSSLPSYHIAVKMMLNAARNTPAFTATTLPQLKMLRSHDRIAKLVYDRSMSRYARPRDECVEEFDERQNYGRDAIMKLTDEGGGDPGTFTML